jgi:hypothetical protein
MQDPTTLERPTKRPRLSGPPILHVADGFTKPKPTSSNARKAKIPVFESHFTEMSTTDTAHAHTVPGENSRVHRGLGITTAGKRRRPEDLPHASLVPSSSQAMPSSDSLERTFSSIRHKPASTSKLPQRALLTPQRHSKPNSHGKLGTTTVQLASSSTPAKILKKADPFQFALPEPETPMKKPIHRLSYPLPLGTSSSKSTTPLRILRPPELIVATPPETPKMRPLPPPPIISKPPSSGPVLSRTITTTGIAKATDPSTVVGNAELLSILLKGQDGLDEEEPGTHPLDRGLFVSPRKQMSTSSKGPKYLRGGLAAQAAIILSQTRTSLSLWQKQMNSHIASSHIPTPDMKLRVLKVVHIPRFTESHPTSRPGFVICKDGRDIVHGVTLSFFSHTGAACAVNGLQRGSEVWIWKPWTVREIKSDDEGVDGQSTGQDRWAAFDDFPEENDFGPMKSVRRRCVDVFVCSHFYVRIVKSSS